MKSKQKYLNGDCPPVDVFTLDDDVSDVNEIIFTMRKDFINFSEMYHWDIYMFAGLSSIKSKGDLKEKIKDFAGELIIRGDICDKNSFRIWAFTPSNIFTEEKISIFIFFDGINQKAISEIKKIGGKHFGSNCILPIFEGISQTIARQLYPSLSEFVGEFQFKL